MGRGVVLMACLAVGPMNSHGFFPHEMLVLVNRSSPDSLAAANRFVEARGIPAQNVVTLALPVSVQWRGGLLSPEEFTDMIWDPIQQSLRERGLEGQVRAWVYSAGFPTVIRHPVKVSLTGLTSGSDVLWKWGALGASLLLLLLGSVARMRRSRSMGVSG